MMKRSNTAFCSNEAEFKKLLQEYCKSDQLYILTDENVSESCLGILLPLISDFSNPEIIEIESGETSKSIEICSHLWSHLLENNADRKALLINLGGGVVSDLGGFVASTYKRGIDYVNIPTSLLAMIDAAIGGKTGIDFNGFKNVIGSFHPSVATLIYPEFLHTLEQQELNSGFAEMLKHAIISDRELWNSLRDVDLANKSSLFQFIEPAAQIKLKIIEQDPYEKNLRKSLNLGHTLGHALESHFLSTNSAISHGEAVALGMSIEANIAGNLNILGLEEKNEILEVIEQFFPKEDYEFPQFAQLIGFIHNDKKNQSGKWLMALPAAIGEVRIDQEVSIEIAEKAYSQFCSAL